MIVSVNSKPDLIEFKNLMLKTDRALNEDAKKRPKYYATRGGNPLEDDVKSALEECAIGTPFENTIENAREILANLGQNIDVVAGIFDETMLKLRGCDATEISREPFCVAVSIHHRLAKKEKITLDDLKGENLMLMKRGWSYYGDKLRDFIAVKNPDINIVDFDLYNIEAFNRCENNNEVLLAFKSWESVHPLIRIIPVEWDYTMPFGILHSKEPSEKVRRLIKAINKIKA